jgi:hypothetical protein
MIGAYTLAGTTLGPHGTMTWPTNLPSKVHPTTEVAFASQRTVSQTTRTPIQLSSDTPTARLSFGTDCHHGLILYDRKHYAATDRVQPFLFAMLALHAVTTALERA